MTQKSGSNYERSHSLDSQMHKSHSSTTKKAKTLISGTKSIEPNESAQATHNDGLDFI